MGWTPKDEEQLVESIRVKADDPHCGALVRLARELLAERERLRAEVKRLKAKLAVEKKLADRYRSVSQ